MFGWFDFKWKWIATIECSWYEIQNGEEKDTANSTYNLYVTDSGKRKCKGYGYIPYEHSFYSNVIEPWLDGGGELRLKKYLNAYSTSYWGDLSKPEKPKNTRLEEML
jgi:hypothetical protein